MTGNIFNILNSCYPLYLLTPREGKVGYTDQNTGMFVPATYEVTKIVGNIETSKNYSRKLDIREGSTITGSKTLICYMRLKIGNFVYYSGDIYEITDESKFTPFMERMIGEMRYTYELNMTTVISPQDFEEYINFGRMDFDSCAFEFIAFDI